jgi:hypothetical protein
VISPAEWAIRSWKCFVDIVLRVWFGKRNATESRIVGEISQGANLLNFHAGEDIFVGVAFSEIFFHSQHRLRPILFIELEVAGGLTLILG